MADLIVLSCRRGYLQFTQTLAAPSRVASAAAVIDRTTAGAGWELRSYAMLRADGETFLSAYGERRSTPTTFGAVHIRGQTGARPDVQRPLRDHMLRRVCCPQFTRVLKVALAVTAIA